MPRSFETKIGTFEVRAGSQSYRIIVKYEEDCSNPDNINSFIKDLGKFETLIDGFNTLTASIGVTENIDFDFKHIDFEDIGDFSINNISHRYEIFINSIETVRGDDRRDLSEVIIENMILNIEKYQSLKLSLDLLNQIRNIN